MIIIIWLDYVKEYMRVNDVETNVRDWDNVSKFKRAHFRTNTVGKGMNPFMQLAMS